MLKLKSPNKKIILAFLIIIIALFLGAYGKIQWIFYNEQLLNISDIPDDVNIESVKSIINNKSGYDIFINGIGLGSVPFIIISALLLGGYLFSQKFSYFLTTGFGNFCIIRSNFKKFFLKSVKVSFFNTFKLIFFCETIFLLVCLILFSSKYPVEGYSNIVGVFKNLYYSNPMLYCFIQIFNQSLFLSIMVLIGIGITYFTRNRVIICLSPFIVYMIVTVISQISNETCIYGICKIIYPDFIILPFLIENSITSSNILDMIIRYSIYFFICICLLFCTYKKFSKNYMR